MFEIPAALAPVFMAGFLALVVGAMAWIGLSALRHWTRQDSPQPLAPWQDEHLMQLQLDGRWKRGEGPFDRTIEAILYAPRADNAQQRPRAARFVHCNRAFGPWVYDGLTRIESKAGVLDLKSRGFSDLPWQFAPQMKLWLVEINGHPFGTLSREDGYIVARYTVGGIAGRWDTPIDPGEWRMARPELGDAPTPLRTRLVVGETELQLRLPYYDARTNRLDFAGQPFLSGAAPGNSNERGWALAFLAIAVHASLSLQTRALKRADQAA